MTSSDAQLDAEFTWIPVELPRCRNLYSLSMWCKRPAGHTGEHAAGFGDGRRRWAE